MRSEQARVVAAIVLMALAIATYFGILLSASPFPPGADPGNILGVSRSVFGEGPDPGLDYAPGVPVILATLRWALGHDTTSLLAAIKVVGIVGLLVQTTGFAALAGAVGGRKAAAWAFALAGIAPIFWLQVLWGGYPQFYAMGFHTMGLALLLRAADAPTPSAHRRRLLAAGVAFGLGVTFHTFSTVYFATAALALLILKARTGGVRKTVPTGARAAAVAGVVALPSIPAYLSVYAHRRAEGPGGSYAHGLLEVSNAFGGRFELAIIWAVLLVLPWVALRWAGRAWPRSFVPAVGACLAGSFALFLVTPPVHVGRIVEFVTLPLVLAAAVALGTLAGGPRARFARRGLGSVLVVAFLVGGTAIAETYPRYVGLHADDLDVFAMLDSEDTGSIVVASPWPNVDGWWAQGLTGKTALVSDHLFWYALQYQADRSVAAHNIVRGTVLLDGGPLKMVDGSSVTNHAAPEVWVHDAFAYTPVLEWDTSKNRVDVVDDAGEPLFWSNMVSAKDRRLDVDPEGTAFHAVSGDGPVAVEQTTRGIPSGGELTWSFTTQEGRISRVELNAFFSPGALLQSQERRGDTLHLLFFNPYDKAHQRIFLQLAATVPWHHEIVGSENGSFPALRLVFEGAEDRIDVRALVGIEGGGEYRWELRSQEDILREWNVTHVYVRGPLTAVHERFLQDPLFEVAWRRHDTTLYRVVAAADADAEPPT